MSNSKKLDFDTMAARLRFLVQNNINPNACQITNSDSHIIISSGIAGMIPHTVIVLVYRFAIAHNLLMFFDTENAQFVLH